MSEEEDKRAVAEDYHKSLKDTNDSAGLMAGTANEKGSRLQRISASAIRLGSRAGHAVITGMGFSSDASETRGSRTETGGRGTETEGGGTAKQNEWPVTL